MFDSNAGEGGGQRLWNKFLSLFNKGKDEVVRSSKVSKTRLDLSSLKREREKVFERLGEEIYKRHKENRVSLSGLDPFFTEIDLVDFKLASKERELKGLKGEEVQEPKVLSSTAPEQRERQSRPRERRPHHPKKEVSQEKASPERESAKTESTEPGSRPRKRYYRPRRRPAGAKPGVKTEGGGS